MRDDAESNRAVEGSPATLLVFEETDRLADQRLADVDPVAMPPDLAVVAYAPDGGVGPVARLAQHSLEAPRRDPALLGRGAAAGRLVRGLFLVEPRERAPPL